MSDKITFFTYLGSRAVGSLLCIKYLGISVPIKYMWDDNADDRNFYALGK